MNNNRSSGVAVAVRRAGFSVMMGATAVFIMLPFAAQAQVAAETAVLSSASKPAAAGSKVKAAKTAVAPRSAYTPVCVGEFAPTVNVNLPEGKSGLLDLQQLHAPSPAWLRSIGDPELLKIEPLTSATPRNMYFLFGQKVGSTNLMFQNKEGRCVMVEVAVGVDTAAVQAKLSQLMPAEKNIRIGAAADSLVLSGMVADAMAIDQVMAIASAYVRKGGAGAASGAGGGSAGGERIVNMLSVAAPQQVMLEVKIAEVSKSLLDKLGVGTTLRTTSGSWAYTLLSNFLSGTVGGLLDATKSNGSQITLEAEKRDGLVRILAEPTVMAISGQEGSFLAGGKIFIPVSQSGASGAITIALEEKEFGVGLKFTPTVLAGGRINIRVAPEVSELSREGVGISATGIAGTNILPLITTRRAATTVQLNDGQSFAIGGLIKNNVTANIKGLPVLGEVPVLGALFRSTDFQQDKTELLFVITPHLVKPLTPNYALPTDNFTDPSRADVLLGGRLEGGQWVAPPASAPTAPAAPPASAMDQGQAPQTGPVGFELK
ncbi:type II and III secretion system protein family protein [Herminiimonas sp. CN]|uniref:type II and III secretion system protein family protein n=1 Tax=Herminiimonas sp. CN TaxID=1349818 RepID=UPI000AC5D236|nr:type II and III secretion system protein family protein [Herminiimonas sp. CN]